jgi:hypothetical protein
MLFLCREVSHLSVFSPLLQSFSVDANGDANGERLREIPTRDPLASPFSSTHPCLIPLPFIY